jgi:hypothetical protein
MMDESPNPDEKRASEGAIGPFSSIRIKKKVLTVFPRRQVEMLLDYKEERAGNGCRIGQT